MTLAACDASPAAEDAGDSGRLDASPGCTLDSQCDDGRFCNGAERCAPGEASSDGRGCVAAESPCAVGQSCDEAARACGDCADEDADGDSHASAGCGGDDCDDGDARRYPGNVEVCDAAGLDEDCNPTTLGRDGDGDGFADEACCNLQPDGSSRCGADCDDARSGVNPGAREICNDLDDDCDGTVDEGVRVMLCPDGDGDLFGDPSAPSMGCPGLLAGYVADCTDCDDASAGRNPGLAEVCDDIADNDCNPLTSPFDADLDGHDRASCGGTDCDDARAEVYAGAPELCDGLDDDCSSGGGALASEDMDGDGFAPIGAACAGGPLPATDCDDTRAFVSPAALETCNGVDDDCDLSADEEPAASGWCARSPGTSASCVAGACVIDGCAAPYQDCNASAADGCEADLDSSTTHCGACDAGCTGGTCTAGACVCAPGSASCAGACIDVTSDRTNCGACGLTCGLGASCGGAACSPHVAWARAYGEATTDEWVLAVASDAAGNIYALLQFSATLTVGGTTFTSRGGTDALIVALDGAGAVRWRRHLGSTASDTFSVLSVDDAGGVYVGGRPGADLDFGGGVRTVSGTNDIAAASYGSDGSHRWSRVYACSAGTGSNYFRSSGVAANGSTFVIALNSTTSCDVGGVTTSGSSRGATIIALDGASGAHRWHRLITAVYSVFPAAVAVEDSGRAYVAMSYIGTLTLDASTFPSMGGDEGALIALDATGATRWYRLVRGVGYDRVDAVVLDGAAVVMLGHSDDATPDFGGGPLGTLGQFKAYLVRFTADGAFVRQRLLYDRAAVVYGIQRAYAAPLAGGGVAIVANARSGTDLGLGTLPALTSLIGFDAMDAPRWQIGFGGPGSATFGAIAALPGGDVAAGGALRGAVGFEATTLSTSTSRDEGLVVRISP